MFPFHRSTVSWLLIFGILLPLVSCANSNLGQAVQDSLAADPKLREAAPDGTLSTIAGDPSSTPVQLPAGFPTEIPRYPGSELREVTPSATEVNQSVGQEVSTRWFSQDGRDRVLAFYQQELQSNNWTLDGAPQTSQPNIVVAQHNELKVTVSIQPGSDAASAASPSPTPTSTESPSPTPTGSPSASPTPTDSPASSSTGTEFIIQYVRESIQAEQPPATTPPSSANQPQETFLGLSGTSEAETAQGTQQTEAIAPLSRSTFTDLTKAPKELKQYVEDLAQLGVLSLSASGTKTNTSPEAFQPNKPVSRREYARWLFATYNRLYADQSAQQIRPAQPSSQPVFRDLPASDPDFAAIQGLAEAGIIPSSLSSSSTTVTFRPTPNSTAKRCCFGKFQWTPASPCQRLV